MKEIFERIFDKNVYSIIFSVDMRKGIRKYINIIKSVKDNNETLYDKTFQKDYKGFYRMRRNDDFCSEYFDKAHKYIDSKNVGFDIIFEEVKNINGKNEASFSSKLLHTINNQKPILDKNVLSNLGLYKEYLKPFSDKKKIYKKLEEIYIEILNSDVGKNWIEQFNKFLVIEKEEEKRKKIELEVDLISDIKKIDFILWKMK